MTNARWKKYSEEEIPGLYPFNYQPIESLSNICYNRTKIFISVINSCKDLDERMAIRMVYKNKNPSIQFHFFIGYTSMECQMMYREEVLKFNDISQIPIKESFANETLFTLYLHKILPTICPTAIFYGKMDADVYINFSKVLHILNKNKKKNNIIYACKVWKLFSIDANQENKYSSPKNVSLYYKQVLPRNGIPCFTGSFALWPNYLSNKLYNESMYERNIIRMDDQHISWLIYKLNKKNFSISFFNLKCIHLLNEKDAICKNPINRLIGLHQIKGSKLYAFSKLISIV